MFLRRTTRSRAKNAIGIDISSGATISCFGQVNFVVFVANRPAEILDVIRVIVLAGIGVFIETHGPASAVVKGEFDAFGCVLASVGIAGVPKAKCLFLEGEAASVVRTTPFAKITALHGFAKFAKGNHAIVVAL